jgi:hypothetical protein
MGGDKASSARLIGDRTGYGINQATGRSGQDTESRAQIEGCSR